MRYITDTGSTTVSLADELDYVQKYLYCMKVRYQSSLNYNIDVDESLLSGGGSQAADPATRRKCYQIWFQLCTTMDDLRQQCYRGKLLEDHRHR